MEKVKAFKRWIVAAITILIVFFAALFTVPVLFPPTPPTGSTDLIDSYSEANYCNDQALIVYHAAAGTSDCGQSFTTLSSDRTITTCKFYLKKYGSPTGTAYAVLYAHTGTYGTSSKPTGSPLATSDGFSVATLTTSYVWYTFTFTISYTMTANTKYCINFANPSSGLINGTNYIQVGGDQGYLTHAGNYFRLTTNVWYADNGLETCFYVYGATIADTSAPVITLNSAGNPNEFRSVDAEYGNSIYRNGTLQTESWMYINATITDQTGVSCAQIEWENGTSLQNYTMTQQSGTNFFYKNMTAQSEYRHYTFNIYANDTLNNCTKYVWRFFDYETVWGTEETYRKYVGLNYATTTNFTYKLAHFKFFDYTANHIYDRALPHEQSTDGSINDTALMVKEFVLGNYTNYCSGIIGYFLDDSISIVSQINITDIYVHVWWSSAQPTTQNARIGVGKDWSFDQTYFCNSTTSKDSYDFDFGYHDIYYLEVTLWNITDVNFTDNEVNLFDFSMGASFPSIVSQSNDDYLQSYIIFNLPSNTTLQGLDSDGDGNNDYNELFVNFTNPLELYGTTLTVGWNNFTAWERDIAHTLGEVNASLNYNSINWSVLTVDYGNGTQWSLVYGTTYNSDKLVASTSDKIWIYCNVAGEWRHYYP